jgi:F420-non-reducing hydrogenase iron-sulfur subunit
VIEETWEILSLLGVDKRRLRLKWISASEGAVFAEEIRSYVQVLRELGDNPLKKNIDQQSSLDPLEEVQKNRT